MVLCLGAPLSITLSAEQRRAIRFDPVAKRVLLALEFTLWRMLLWELSRGAHCERSMILGVVATFTTQPLIIP